MWFIVSCSDITSSVDADRHSLTVTSAGSSDREAGELGVHRSFDEVVAHSLVDVDTERPRRRHGVDQLVPAVVVSWLAQHRQVPERHRSDGIDAGQRRPSGLAGTS